MKRKIRDLRQGVLNWWSDIVNKIFTVSILMGVIAGGVTGFLIDRGDIKFIVLLILTGTLIGTSIIPWVIFGFIFVFEYVRDFIKKKKRKKEKKKKRKKE